MKWRDRVGGLILRLYYVHVGESVVDDMTPTEGGRARIAPDELLDIELFKFYSTVVPSEGEDVVGVGN